MLLIISAIPPKNAVTTNAAHPANGGNPYKAAQPTDDRLPLSNRVCSTFRNTGKQLSAQQKERHPPTEPTAGRMLQRQLEMNTRHLSYKVSAHRPYNPEYFLL